MRELDRKRAKQMHADRRTIDQAAAFLRHRAAQDGYAGLHDPDRCYALAGLLDMLALQLDQLPPGLREDTARTARWLVEGSRSLTTRRPD